MGWSRECSVTIPRRGPAGLTLNPLAHVDPFGTIILPGLLLFAHAPVFGYAKPVPVDFRRLTSAARWG